MDTQYRVYRRRALRYPEERRNSHPATSRPGGNIVATAFLGESETKLRSTYNSTEFGVPQPGAAPPKYAWLGAGGIFTEATMESGVATQGGASYVPQVARNVQTAPVVPPGAFPNGTPGTQYEGAEVSPAGLKIAEEKATQTWQNTEAERQKQKGEEVLQELRKCRAEGGCGAGPSGSGGAGRGIEGGGEGEGSGAAAASVPLCQVKWKMDEFNPGVLTMSAGFFCKHTVANFELQFQVWGRLPGETLHEISSAKQVFSNTDGEEGLMIGECVQGEIYTAWIWGRTIAAGGGTSQSYGGSSVQKAATFTCEGNNSEVEQDSFETFW